MYFLNLDIRLIQHCHQVLEAFGPKSGFEDGQQRHNVLASRITDHGGRVGKRGKHCSFCIARNFRGGLEDEACVVLEEIASNGADTIILIGHRMKDICEIPNIIWNPRELIKFLYNAQ